MLLVLCAQKESVLSTDFPHIREAEVAYVVVMYLLGRLVKLRKAVKFSFIASIKLLVLFGMILSPFIVIVCSSRVATK